MSTLNVQLALGPNIRNLVIKYGEDFVYWVLDQECQFVADELTPAKMKKWEALKEEQI